ncbi:unnamed protein product [marine sediment metagenome]|uniref:Uncharacterized protein n=1 Tax=marine sediment metagenome TaxID=412755 RepID=X1FG71_9ZZZZ
MIMSIEKKGDKVKFSIHICDICASERQMKFDIFRLKRTRVRNKQPCAICNASTNTSYVGIADSETEAEQIKEKLA